MRSNTSQYCIASIQYWLTNLSCRVDAGTHSRHYVDYAMTVRSLVAIKVANTMVIVNTCSVTALGKVTVPTDMAVAQI